MLEITSGTVQSKACALAFQNLLKKWSDGEGVCFIGYPIFSSMDGRMPIDALMVLPSKGIVVVNFVEGRTLPGDYQDLMDDVYNKLQAKLQGCKALVERRSLCVAINVVTYAPAINVQEQIPDYAVCNDDTLISYLIGLRDDDASKRKYRNILSALQSITALRAGIKKRQPAKSGSRGAIVQRLESSIATLDYTQGRAVIETVEGVQRIRGLAGSGKTIVLALKAAYLHSQHPEWKICVTFYTRSLKEQFKRLITGFVIESTSSEPDWNNLRIMHAWGAGVGEREGMYYNYCVAKGVSPLDYKTARSEFPFKDPFLGACDRAFNAKGNSFEEYDAILVDEAQDLPASFLRICYEVLKEPKRLVYAYDELQSLKQLSLPPPEEIFGTNELGQPNVIMASPSQDITLAVCYRNSKPVLTTAHALGFGIYRKENPRTKTGLVQMFEDRGLWNEVGYVVESGTLNDNENVVLTRTEKTSPSFLEDGLSLDDMIIFKRFENDEDQDAWLVNEIQKNLAEDELRPDDIIVINPDPISTRAKTTNVRAKLVEMGINAHLVGVDTSPDVFFSTAQSSIAFTGVYRAKGNEAAMVYIINAQDCYDSQMQLSTVRNQLFTSITRSKAWVRVLGVGESMDMLIDEFNKVKGNGYKLNFKYPNAETRQKIKIVNRDKSWASYKQISTIEKSIGGVIEAIASGAIHKEDLSPDLREKLKDIIS